MEFRQDRVTTFHDFGAVEPEIDLESVGVVVPVSGDDADRPAVHRTLEILADIDPGRIVVPIRANRATVARFSARMSSLPATISVIDCEGEQVQRALCDAGIDVSGGKGVDVWLGLAAATASTSTVVVHDADAASYDRTDLAKLAWPVQHDFEFAKGYYARIEEGKLYGRLVRLLWAPIIRALAEEKSAPIIAYLDAFRYPLAGEFALTASLARSMRIPHGWGLETGTLGESFRLVGAQGSAQVDLGRHQHDHRPVDGAAGLAPVANAVIGTLFDVLNGHGYGIPGALVASYRRHGRRLVTQYGADAAFNGLSYDREGELEQIQRYAALIPEAPSPTWLPPLRETTIDPVVLEDSVSPSEVSR